MFLGIFSTLLQSLGDIFWKKSLEIHKDISPNFFNIIGMFFGALLSIILICFGKFDLRGFDSVVILLIILNSLIWFFSSKIEQNIYKNEKISVLLPYQNLSQVLVILSAFFLFQKSSLISVLFALAIIGVIILSNISHNKIEFPRFFGVFLVYEVLSVSSIIIVTWVLISLSHYSFFIVDAIIAFSLNLLSVIFLGKLREFSQYSQKFYAYRAIGNITWNFGFLISLFVISQYGIIYQIILSFAGIVFTLIFGYIFLKDIPRKKDVFLAFVVSILISLGFYFG